MAEKSYLARSQTTMAEQIGAIIRQWLRENNLEDRVKASTVPTYWEDIVGPTVARHATVERIERGAMIIRVESAAWRNEIMLRRDHIRQKVNERFGSEIVREIVVR